MNTLNLKAINLEYLTLLQEHSKAKESLMTAVLKMYLDTPAALNDLKSAFEKRNRELINRTAHSLKSSSTNVGAHIVGPLCATIESMTTTQHPSPDFAALAELLKQLEPAHADAVREVRQILEFSSTEGAQQ